jgi:RNase P/RNase MRP subunit POP5
LVKPRAFVIYWNSITNLAIIRILRDHVRFVLASITINLKQLRGRQVLTRCVHVSGTIRSSKQSILSLAKENLIDARVVEDLSKIRDESNAAED